MKKWVISLSLAVLLFATAVASVAWWRPDYLLRGIAMVSPEFAANVMINWRERMAENMAEEGRRNLESEVIRIEMEGHRYNVPMRYAYGQAIEKRGYWPTAKPERVKVGALSLSVLLPDLKPYYPEDEARWKVKGHGERLEVDITGSSGSQGWLHQLRDRYLRGEEKLSTRMPDAYGLTRFAFKRMEDAYFPIGDDFELIISCDKNPENLDPKNFYSPSCRVKSNYKADIVLEYTYARKYLQNWRQIDTDLKTLFDRFEQSATTESVKEEK
ncbi:MAG: hypothetical protein IDH49_15455 [Gammaproteobacteria bacterium]|nr:hypothetical protein [Gammaproteobacteria bacterium]